MTHIKFLSISNRWTAERIIKRIGSHLKLSEKDLKNVNLVHIEDLQNQRFHMRVAANNYQLINKLKNKAEATKDGKAYFIKMRDLTIMFVIIEGESEKFKLQRINENSNLRNLVLWFKMKADDNILSILKLLVDKRIRFNYLSVRNSSTFVHIQTLSESRRLMKFMKDNKVDVRFSSTCMYIERKLSGKQSNQFSRLTIRTSMKKKDKKKVPEHEEINNNGNEKSGLCCQTPQIIPMNFGMYNQPANAQMYQPMTQMQISTFNPFQQNVNQASIIDLSKYNIALIPKPNH